MGWRRAIATVLLGLAVCRCRKPAATRAGAGPLRIAVPYEVSTLDPHAEDRVTNFAALVNLYQPLVTTDAELRLQPCLARSWESPDPLTWILRLRPGVTFHGGGSLRAADVVYSLDRVRRHPELEIRNYLENVAEVTALDDLTVRIRTVVPSRIFLSKLRFVMIVPEGASDASLRSGADGTGPYRLAAWRPGEWMRMTRNPHYWGQAPAVGEVEFRLNLSNADLRKGLLLGDFGIALYNSKELEPGADLLARYTVVRIDNLFVPYLGWDLARPVTPFCSIKPNPFRDVRVRRAVSLALDRSRLLAGLSGYATPATQLVPRFVFGFDPGIPEPTRDLAQARRLLRDAGLPGGFEVVLHARSVLAEAAHLLKRDLAEIGINAEIRVLPNDDFFALKRQGATLWLDRWACTSGDASDLLDNLVHSVDHSRGLGAFNYEGYANPETDRVIERSAGTEKVEDRQRLLQQAMAATARDLVLLPLYDDQDAYAIDKSLAWRPRDDRHLEIAEIAPAPQP